MNGGNHMKKKNAMIKLYVTTISLIFSLIFNNVNPALCYNVVQKQTLIDEDEWILQNYETVLNITLRDRDWLNNLPSNSLWVIHARIEPSHNEPEFGFSIIKYATGEIEALLITPERESILSQLYKLRKKFPHNSVEEISKMISVKIRKVKSQHCPQLARLTKVFEQIEFSPDIGGDLILDGTGYDIFYQTRWGNSLKIRLNGVNHDNQKNQFLINWIESIREQLRNLC